MPSAHTHDDVEMSVLLRGWDRGMYCGRYIRQGTGQVIVGWAGVPHQVLTATRNCQIVVVTLPLQWVQQWDMPREFVETLLAGWIIGDADQDPPVLERRLFGRWQKLFSNGDPKSRELLLLEIRVRLLRIAMNMNVIGDEQDAPGQAGSPSGVGPVAAGARLRVDETMQFIAKNHGMEELSLARIAKGVGCNPTYLSTIFSRHTGQSILHYLTSQRVAHAQRLLATTDMKLITISGEAGFGSLPRFYAAFRRHVGQSPGAWRRSLRQAQPPC